MSFKRCIERRDEEQKKGSHNKTYHGLNFIGCANTEMLGEYLSFGNRDEIMLLTVKK